MMQLGLILQLAIKTRHYRVLKPYQIYELYWCPSCTFAHRTLLQLTTRIQYQITPTVHYKYGQATLVDNAVRSVEYGAVFHLLQDVTRRTRCRCFIRVTIRKQDTTLMTCTHQLVNANLCDRFDLSLVQIIRIQALVFIFK